MEKIPLNTMITLRIKNKLSYSEIGRQLGCSRQYVAKVLKQFKGLIGDPDIISAYSNYRGELLSSAEFELLRKLVDAGKIEKASLNNVAYAFNQIHTARRLEEGKGTAGGVTVNIEIAYQEATERSKEIRMKLIGSGLAAKSINSDDDN